MAFELAERRAAQPRAANPVLTHIRLLANRRLQRRVRLTAACGKKRGHSDLQPENYNVPFFSRWFSEVFYKALPSPFSLGGVSHPVSFLVRSVSFSVRIP